MYYTDLTNTELLEFHKVKCGNFSAKLSYIKTSNFFKTEEIIANEIYKIYPLFYCDEITSSNSDDKILGTQCIIANQTSNETYYHFKNYDSTQDEVVMTEDLFTAYDINDTLTTSQFNSVVQLLRVNNTSQENISIINSTVVGEFGSYTFDLESTTVVDNGVLITAETLTNLGTVTLTNPTFPSSVYYLDLTVVAIDDINIQKPSTDYTTTTTLTVTLTEDTAVNIPFNTLELDNVVLFDATVRVEHTEPIIQQGE